ncbi:MAG: TonB-dependent receptor [Gemmatimonadetes bacterium]|jgi:Fe(3+) dicitrate transport protein|nr:TonB-dependent receptor [Gemmatimonadota bacterium]
MSRSILAVAALLFLTLTLGQATAQQNQTSVTGNVVDAETQSPIASAVVSLRSGGEVTRSTTSDDEGTFRFSNLIPGPLELHVLLVGYRTHTEKLVLRPGVDLTPTVALTTDPIQLLPLEVIGRSPRVFKKLPGTVSRLESESVGLIRPIGIQELLEMVPGINGYADDGFANSRLSIGIRGLNPRRSSRVLVLEDGVPIQPALYVYPNMYYNPPSERINEVEIIKGSSAIRFGPHTMGGVINYTTRKPGGEAGRTIQLTGGNNAYASVFTEFSGFGSEAVKSDVQLLYKRGNGFRQNNDFDQVNGTVKSHFFLSDRKILYVKANANYENSNATYTGLTEYSFARDPNFNPKEDDNFKVFRASLDVLYTSEITENLTGNTTVYTSYFDRRWWREDDIFVRPATLQAGNLTAVPYFINSDLVRVGNGRSNFGILRTFYVGGVEQNYTLRHESGELQVGARGHWERFIDDKKAGNAPNARDGVYFTGSEDDPTIVGQSHHYETAALSLYVNEQYEAGSLTLSPGIRFEYFGQDQIDRLRGSILSDKITHVLLPGLGINYAIGDYNLFGGIHRGYTPPSSGTLRVTNFGQNVATGGLDLESEKSWNMEAGLRTWQPGLRLEIAGYWIKVSDLVAAGRGTAFRNLGKVQTYGIEAGGSIRFSRYAKALPDINFSYTYLKTEIESGRVRSGRLAGNVEVDLAGNELPYAPEHTLTLGFSKRISSLNLRADWRYVDEVFTDFENLNETLNRGDTGPVPSHHILNASAEYDITSDWTVSVTGKNILDKVYIGSRLHSNPGQPQANLSSGILIGPRRQVNFGIKYGL